MIASQRRLHKFVWMGLAIVVPFLMFFAIKNLSFKTHKEIQLNNERLITTFNGETVKIELIEPLKTPSAVIYQLDTSGRKDKVLGQIESLGTYEYPVSGPTMGIVIVDEIKNEEIFKIRF